MGIYMYILSRKDWYPNGRGVGTQRVMINKRPNGLGSQMTFSSNCTNVFINIQDFDTHYWPSDQHLTEQWFQGSYLKNWIDSDPHYLVIIVAKCHQNLTSGFRGEVVWICSTVCPNFALPLWDQALFSSHETKSQVSFTDPNSSVVVCRSSSVC